MSDFISIEAAEIDLTKNGDGVRKVFQRFILNIRGIIKVTNIGATSCFILYQTNDKQVGYEVKATLSTMHNILDSKKGYSPFSI